MEEHQQNAQIAGLKSASPYRSPMYDFGSSIIYLTDPSNELHELELQLRGLKKVNDKLVTVGQPLLNELGISRILAHVDSIVNQVTIMSNLSEKKINYLMLDFADSLIKHLMENRKYWQIPPPVDSNRTAIFSWAKNRAYICIHRSLEGDDKRFWKGSTQEITTRVDGQSNKNRFPRMLGWGK